MFSLSNKLWRNRRGNVTVEFALFLPFFLLLLVGGLEIAALPSDVTVESLMTTLGQTEDESERRSAVWTLGQFGPAAKAAVPAIQELLDDTKLKFVAEFALKKINGK